MDLLVFAPAGLLLTAAEDLPAMAAKGRARVELGVRNAQMIGKLAVTFGRKDLAQRIGRLSGTRPPAPTSPRGGGESRTASGPPAVPVTPPPGAPGPPAAGSRPSPSPSAAPLAIPDYDALSASQVVSRLAGLTREELRAVQRHEASGRRRRTILHRAQQLLGDDGL